MHHHLLPEFLQDFFYLIQISCTFHPHLKQMKNECILPMLSILHPTIRPFFEKHAFIGRSMG